MNGHNNSHNGHSRPHGGNPAHNSNGNGNDHHPHQPRERASQHKPVAGSDEDMYILTLIVSPKLQKAMDSLREAYFPRRLNHLSAHLTLFHALPSSRLESDVLPALDRLCKETFAFGLAATTPFKLKRGLAIGMPKNHGGDAVRDVHTTLVRQWSEFVSQQDLSFGPHFTVMNKVRNEAKVEEAFERLSGEFKAAYGRAKGISVYKYRPGAWEPLRDFEFRGL